MKSKANQKGSALIVVMIVVAVLSGLVVFMLEDSTDKMTNAIVKVEDSQCFNLAEGAVDLSIAELNIKNDGKLGTDTWSLATDDTNGNGYPDFGEPNVNPLNLGSGEVFAYAVHWLTDGVDNDGINGVDDIGEENFYIIYCGARDSSITRYGATVNLEVIVAPAPSSMFRMALFADKGAKLLGDVFSDSYDSRLGTYAAQKVNVSPVTGQDYAKTNGDAGSNQDITVGGDVTLLGKVSPGPTGVLYTSGTSIHILNGNAPLSSEIELEVPTYNPPAIPNPSLKLVNTKVETLTGSADPSAPTSFRYSTIDMAGGTIAVSGNVALYVDGDIKMSAFARIKLDPGAKLTLYHGSGDLKLTGHADVNPNQQPENFIVQSSTTEDVTLIGGSAFCGAVYAPSSSINFLGDAEVYGALVGSTLDVLGGAEFHYDEALGAIPGATSRYMIKAWRKID